MGRMSERAMMEAPDREYSYFMWLCDLIHADKGETSYTMLAERLFREPFRWYIGNDDNRAVDGIMLRSEYDPAYERNAFETPCSVFEFLIALARRMEFTTSGDLPFEAAFWEMIVNVGLDKYTDDYCGVRWSNGIAVYGRDISKICDTFLERKITWTGKHGLFPLRKRGRDQRKAEFWFQMQAYLIENYD